MPEPINLAEALRANLDSSNKALDTYLESVIDAKTYHALHDATVAAKAAYDGYHEDRPDIDELPPVIGEKYRDVVARRMRTADAD